MTAQTNATAPVANEIVLTDDVLNEIKDFAHAYVSGEIAQINDDRNFSSILKGQTYKQRMATRACFIHTAEQDGYMAPDKLWERTLKRCVEFYGVEIPKAETKKAQDVAKSREAAKQAADVIAKAKLGVTVAEAKPEDLLQLATDPKLTTANKKALADAAIKRERELQRERDKASNEADKAMREEARALLNGMHGKTLEKAIAALRKIK